MSDVFDASWRAAYRVALLALPRRLRRERGGEMEAVFAEVVAESRGTGGRGRGFARAMREVADVVETGVRLRFGRGGPWRGRGRGGGRERGGWSMGELASDARSALRGWARRPAFALVTVGTLALAIGATTVIFSVLDAALLEPMPYRDAERLTMVWQRLPRLGWERGPVSYLNWSDMRAQARSFEDIAAFRTRVPMTLRTEAGVEQVLVSQATGNLFAVLGVGARHGRVLAEADARPEAPSAVVLSHGLWRRAYGGDPAAVGREMVLDGVAHAIVGVMPESFDFPSRRDEAWVTLRGIDALADRDTHFLQAVGRLRPGVSLAAAQREMEAVWDRLRVQYPAVFGENRPNLESRRELVSGGTRPILVMLFGAVSLLFAAACANLANLMLMRGSARVRELAVRAALGAGRRRLLRQLLTESAVLALLGAAAGLAVALAGTRLVLLLGPESLPRRDAIAVDARALAFTLAVAALSMLLFGLVPALRASRVDLQPALREGTRAGAGRRSARLQRSLVVAQVAVAMVLLTGAGLLVHSFVRLSSRSPGFDPGDLLTARVAPGRSYAEFARVRALHEGMLERAAAIPGVRAVGAVWALPFTEDFASGRIVVEGVATSAGQEPQVGMYPVLGDYFGALRVPLLRGRLHGPQDREDAPPVTVINQAMADRFWPGQDPIGKRFKRGDLSEFDEEPWVTVIGVVGDVHRFGLDETVPAAEMYAPHAQSPWARDMWFVLRTEGDPLGVVDALRAELSALDPGLPLTSVRTMTDRISESVAEPRFRALLVACFATLAAILALVGIYGVLGFAVAERRYEIGVRMALGAERGRVLREVLTQGATLVVAGIAIGLAGAWYGSRWIAAMLFGITPLHAPTWTAVALTLLAAGLFACWLPARRASRVEPITALRQP